MNNPAKNYNSESNEERPKLITKTKLGKKTVINSSGNKNTVIRGAYDRNNKLQPENEINNEKIEIIQTETTSLNKKGKDNSAEFLLKTIMKAFFLSQWKKKIKSMKYYSRRYIPQRANFKKLINEISSVIKQHKGGYFSEIYENMKNLPFPDNVEHDYNFGKLRIVSKEFSDKKNTNKNLLWKEGNYKNKVNAFKSLINQSIKKANEKKPAQEQISTNQNKRNEKVYEGNLYHNKENEVINTNVNKNAKNTNVLKPKVDNVKKYMKQYMDNYYYDQNSNEILNGGQNQGGVGQYEYQQINQINIPGNELEQQVYDENNYYDDNNNMINYDNNYPVDEYNDNYVEQNYDNNYEVVDNNANDVNNYVEDDANNYIEDDANNYYVEDDVNNYVENDANKYYVENDDNNYIENDANNYYAENDTNNYIENDANNYYVENDDNNYIENDDINNNYGEENYIVNDENNYIIENDDNNNYIIENDANNYIQNNDNNYIEEDDKYYIDNNGNEYVENDNNLNYYDENNYYDDNNYYEDQNKKTNSYAINNKYNVFDTYSNSYFGKGITNQKQNISGHNKKSNSISNYYKKYSNSAYNIYENDYIDDDGNQYENKYYYYEKPNQQVKVETKKVTYYVPNSTQNQSKVSKIAYKKNIYSNDYNYNYNQPKTKKLFEHTRNKSYDNNYSTLQSKYQYYETNANNNKSQNNSNAYTLYKRAFPRKYNNHSFYISKK